MCSRVELHDQLIVPLCELLANKLVNLTGLEAIINTWEVIFILSYVGPVHPSHVTHYGLLVKQDSLIEILLFLCVEPIIHSSSPPDSIWVSLPPLSQTCILLDPHILCNRVCIIMVWNLRL